jgi:hypothetical protein
MDGNFTVVENQNMLGKLFSELDYFHDALIKKVSLFTDAYIDKNGFMFGDGDPYHARLLIQFQSLNGGGIELVFHNVETINIAVNFPLVPSGLIDRDKVVLSLSQEPYASRFMIVAKQLLYRHHERLLVDV